MDFYTEEQCMIRDTAREFARNELAPNAAKWEKDGWIADAAVSKMGELGLLGMMVPEEWGGSYTDYVAYALAIEEIAAGCASTAAMMSVHSSVACGPILDFGHSAQKRAYLPDMAGGSRIGCFCLTESQAGSDAGNLRTRAVLENGRWVLNGSKQFVTNGKRAKVAIVFAVTDAQLGKKGISAFIVPTDSPGLHRQPAGAQARDPRLRHLRDHAGRLQPSPRISSWAGVATGWRLRYPTSRAAASALQPRRWASPAQPSMPHSRTRASASSSARPIVQHQSIGNMLADMQTRINAARMLTHRAARLRTEGVPCLSEASQAKLYASELAEWVCSKAIQIHGGYGYLEDYPVERHYRDARITQLYEGTSEIQRMVIVRSLA